MAASESSTYTIDTSGEQDGHVRVSCIGNCPVQPADQLKKKERGAMAYQHDIHSGAIANRRHGSIVVMVMSNCRGVHPVSQAMRWSRAQRRRIQIQQPNTIKEYTITIVTLCGPRMWWEGQLRV